MKIGTIMQTGNVYYVPLKYNLFEKILSKEDRTARIVEFEGVYFDGGYGSISANHPISKAINEFRKNQIK